MADKEELERIRTGLLREIESYRNRMAVSELQLKEFERLLKTDATDEKELTELSTVGVYFVEGVYEAIAEINEYIEELQYCIHEDKPDYTGSN